MFQVKISEPEYPPSRRYSRLPLPSLSLSVLLSHSVTSLVSPYLSLAVLLLACLCLSGLSTSAKHQPECLPLGPSFLISLTDPLITLIGFSRVVGFLVISGRLAPAARLAVNFISVTVNYKYTSALHITVYIYAYLRYLDCLLLVYS